MKHYVEECRDTEITWESPFVELHYPIEWDWNAPRDGDVVYSKLVSGKITKRNTGNTKAAQKTLAEIMVRHLNTMALQDFTNHAWLEKRKNYGTPILPAELGAKITAIKNRRARREAFERFFRPFSIGAALIDYGDPQLRDGARVPKRVARQLANIDDLIDIRRIGISGDVNGRKVEMSLIFQIQPLMVDYDVKKAYYPVTVGLFTEPRVVGHDLVTATPLDWPKKDRAALWEQLLREVAKLADKLIPQSESQNSTILTINAELEIPQIHSGTDAVNAVIQKTLKTLAEAGLVLKFHHELSASGKMASASARQSLAQLSQLVERSKTPDEKGRALEALVGELLKTIKGFETQNRIRTETEEIDFVVSNDSDDAALKREEAIILVECKNWSSTCRKDDFFTFKEKMRNRNERCSLGFLVSWNGFAGTITKEMLRGSHERLLVVPMDGTQIREAVREGSFLKTIKSALDKATMI